MCIKSFHIWFSLLFLDSDFVSLQTSLQTTVIWGNIYPTLSPSGSLSYRHPYLFYSTITFGIIILGTAILIITKSCFRNCSCSTSHRYCTSECTRSRPVLSRYRPSLVSAEAMLINHAESLDKPPDYATAIRIKVEVPKNDRTMNEKTLLYSESPPPPYGSISNNTQWAY